MKVRETNTESILANLRTFSYTTVEDGETVTKNVELFTSSQTPIANKLFLQLQGDLRADDILQEYKDGDISAEDLAGMILVMIKSQLVQLWKEWEADYNPLWNVDGIEKRTIKTEFGKIVEHEKDSKITDEQKVSGSDNLTHGLKVVDEQKVDGKDNLTHGLKVVDEQKTDGKDNLTHGLATTITEPVNTHKIAAFDSQTPVTYTEDSATSHSNTNSGSDNRTISMGKIEHENSGSDNRTISMGKIEHENSGTDQRTMNMGKIEHVSSGKDTDTDDGEENVTDIYERHGNIGVTMSTQLLRDGDNFWSSFNFFEKYFSLIAEQISIPIYD